MNHSTIYSEPVIDFLTVAAEYCSFLEQCRGVEQHEFIERVTKLLPLIYVKASLLPEQEEEDTFGFGYSTPELPIMVTEEDYEYVRHSIWSTLEADDDYLEVFTPDMQFSEGAITVSISEDLTDIYQDLKNFCAIYADRNEQCMPFAIQQLTEQFRHYWGQRLVNAMRPLHEVLYRNS